MAHAVHSDNEDDRCTSSQNNVNQCELTYALVQDDQSTIQLGTLKASSG